MNLVPSLFITSEYLTSPSSFSGSDSTGSKVSGLILLFRLRDWILYFEASRGPPIPEMYVEGAEQGIRSQISISLSIIESISSIEVRTGFGHIGSRN